MNFYDFLQNRVLIVFRPKFEEPNDDMYPEFELVLSKKMNYDIVSWLSVSCYFLYLLGCMRSIDGC